MFETACKDAIRKLITDNATTIVAGLTFQGAAISLGTLTTEKIVPPKQYPYIAIDVEHWEIVDSLGPEHFSNIQQVRGQFPYIEYRVVLEILWAGALPQTGDTYSQYDAMGKTFDTIVGRIVKLIFEAASFTDAAGQHTFKLTESKDARWNRHIGVDTLDATALQTGGLPAFYARVQFRLSESCPDLSLM